MKWVYVSDKVYVWFNDVLQNGHCHSQITRGSIIVLQTEIKLLKLCRCSAIKPFDCKTYHISPNCNFEYNYLKKNHHTLSGLLVHLSRIVRKPAFCICENKGTDQFLGNCEADQHLRFRYIASTIPLTFSKYKF